MLLIAEVTTIYCDHSSQKNFKHNHGYTNILLRSDGNTGPRKFTFPKDNNYISPQLTLQSKKAGHISSDHYCVLEQRSQRSPYKNQKNGIKVKEN